MIYNVVNTFGYRHLKSQKILLLIHNIIYVQKILSFLILLFFFFFLNHNGSMSQIRSQSLEKINY